MNIISRLKAGVSAFAAPVPMAEAAPAPAPAGVNDNDEGWRRLSSAPNRALTQISQKRQQELAAYLWKMNPLARFMVEIMVAYLLAEGVKPTVPDAEAQGWLDEFWRDPVTRMNTTLSDKVRELSLYGEQCWPVFRDNLTGHIRLGVLDPVYIEDAIRDPDNAAMVIGVKKARTDNNDGCVYRTIIAGPESVFTHDTQVLRASFTGGECYYFSVNALTGERGASDLLSQMDWLDAYDKALFGEIERWDALRAFLWDVTLSGADEETVRRRAAEIDVPDGGGISVHNDKETWTAVTPDLQATSGDGFARLFRNHIMGGGGLPEHWFGGGGDVNLATAGAMGEPTYKMMTMRQTDIKHMLETICAYVIHSRLEAIGLEDMAALSDYIPSVAMPEMTAKDTTAYAGALAQIATALTMAVDRALLSDETAVKLLATMAERLGVAIDPAAELDAARQDARDRPAKDAFPGFEG